MPRHSTPVASAGIAAQPRCGTRRLSPTLPVKSLVSLSLVLALVGVGAVAWQNYQELVTLRARMGSDADRTALERSLADARRHNRELEAELAAFRGRKPGDATNAADADGDAPKTAAAAVLANLAAAESPEAKGESRREAELDLLSAMADLPEFQQLIALQQRAKIDAKYAGLFKKLNLSPAQQQQLESLLADRQSAFADAMIAAHDQGLSGKDARQMAATVARATDKEIDGSIKSLLGQDGYKEYHNYERTMPQRETVTQLAQRLSYTSSPLTAHQQDQLVQTLATTVNPKPIRNANGTVTKPARQPTTVPPVPGLSGFGIASSSTAVITPAAINRAQNFLSPQQLTALQQMQQEQQAQQTLGNLIRSGTGKNPPPPAPKKSGKG